MTMKHRDVITNLIKHLSYEIEQGFIPNDETSLAVLGTIHIYRNDRYPIGPLRHKWDLRTDPWKPRCSRCGLREDFLPVPELRPDGKQRAVWVFPDGSVSMKREVKIPVCEFVQNGTAVGQVRP